MSIKYTFPRKSLDLLVSVLGPEKANSFIDALESSIDDIVNAKYEIRSNLQKEETKAELTNQFINQLATKQEVYEIKEEIHGIKLEFKEEINKLKMLIVVVIILGLTSNPLISNLILSFIK